MTYTSFQHVPEGLEPDRPLSTPPQMRVGSETLRCEGGQVTSSSGASYQSTGMGTPGAGVASTLSSTFGEPSVELVPGDPSSRTNVRTAERMGFIKRTANGWADVAGATLDPEPARAPQEEEAAPVDHSAGLFQADGEQDLNEAIQPLGQDAVDMTTASLVGVVSSGNGSIEDSALSLAQRTGMEPAEAHALVDHAVALYQDAADEALGKAGLHGEALAQFYAHVRGRPQELTPAIQQFAYARDPRPLVALATDWMARQERIRASSGR